MNFEQFQFDLTPSRDMRPGDKPIRLTPTVWKKIRDAAQRRSVDIDSVGVVTIVVGKRFAAALRDSLKAGGFAEDVVPVVEQVVALLGQGRGLIVQRRTATAGTALLPNNHKPEAKQPVAKLPEEFEQFRLDKTKSAR